MGQMLDLQTGTLRSVIRRWAWPVIRWRCGLARIGSAGGLPSAAGQSGAARPPIDLDSLCVFVLDAAHVASSGWWYHRVGNEARLTWLSPVAERLPASRPQVGASGRLLLGADGGGPTSRGQCASIRARVASSRPNQALHQTAAACRLSANVQLTWAAAAAELWSTMMP